jgi:citronellol/citronellal dehydrogenase
MNNLCGKTLLVTGGSRGIGEAIALRAARDGANVVIAAKTTEANPKLPGTIFTVAEAIRAVGGQALAVPLDIRDETQVRRAVEIAVAEYGGVDILINNASAIHLAGTLQTPMKRFDLMHQVNVRGTFAMSQACIPHLLKAHNPHILNLSPPLNLEPHWFGSSLAYSLSKYGMSLCVLGLAEEFRKEGIAVNALWPRTVIATAALQAIPGGQELAKRARRPQIVADAAHAVLCRNSRECTGQFFIDEAVLRAEGVGDFSGYAVDASQPLQTDLFL